MLDREALSTAIPGGVGLRVRHVSGDNGPVSIAVDYAGFARGFGGDFGARLRLVQLPACAAVTPEKPECQNHVPVASSLNDEAARVVSAEVPVAPAGHTDDASAPPDAPVFALLADATGPGGDFTRTTLSESATWSAGESGGGFSWSYPLRAPSSPAGPQPSLSLAYSSSSVDGRTVSTNAQASEIGEGFSFGPGFVERRYASCRDHGGSNNDLCWRGENLVVSLLGRVELAVKDGASGQWRLESDPGWRIEQIFASGLGAHNGEHWKITTPDGTRYFFGKRKRFATDTADTESVSNVPVYGKNAGEPCHQNVASSSWCHMGWRWNLDYVVDTSGNSLTYFYDRQFQRYGIWNNSWAVWYDRAAILRAVEYGTRAGQENAGLAPYRVDVGIDFRCVQGSSCGPRDGRAYPDVPWDQYCEVSAKSCPGQTAPTFWSDRKITSVTTKVRNGTGTGYRDVDRYNLSSYFPANPDGSTANLWLAAINRTGAVDGRDVALPPVTFYGTPYANRALRVGSRQTPLTRYRLERIDSETGARTQVTYHRNSAADCYAGDGGVPVADWNARLCFPQYWRNLNSGQLVWSHWNKYTVNKVEVSDPTGGSPTETWTYRYSLDGASSPQGKPIVLWGHDNDYLRPLSQRSWSTWLGYPTVVVTHGVDGGPQTSIRKLFLRGSEDDRTTTGWHSRHVTMTNSEGATMPDWPAYRGRLWEETLLDGPGGAPQQITTRDFWIRQMANQKTTEVDLRSYAIRDAAIRDKVWIAGTGTWRTTETRTDYDDQGFPTKVTDRGDVADDNDEVCTTLSYTRDPGAWIMNLTAQSETTPCRKGVTSGPPLAGTRTFYDGATALTTAPTRGLATRVDALSGSTPVMYTTVTKAEYDALGRNIKTLDALNRPTTIAYTPAGPGPVTSVTTTNAAGHASTTTMDPARGLPTGITDANGKKSHMAYDGLGRLAAIWAPGRVKDTDIPNASYHYSLSNTSAPHVKTSSLGPNGTSIDSFEIYDSRLRPRQRQTPTATGGGERSVTDTRYNMLGSIATISAFKAAGAPAGALLAFNDPDVPRQYRRTVDNLGRVTSDQLWGAGVKVSQTAIAYDGDSTTVTPPAGGTATRSIADAHGRTTTLRQYLGATPTGEHQDTTFRYDLLGRRTSATTAGSTWTTTYDTRGRVTSKIDPDAGRMDLTYDDAGHVLTSTDSRGTKLFYAQDILGRRTGVSTGSVTGPKLASWTYDTLALGTLSSTTRHHATGDYTTTVAALDDNYRPLRTNISIPASQGALAGTYDTNVTYTVDGSPATVTYPATGELAAETVTYTYNSVGYLVAAKGADTYLADVKHYHDGGIYQRLLGDGGKQVTHTTRRDETTRRLTTSLVSVERAGTPGVFDEKLTENYTYDPVGNVTGIAESTAAITVSQQCFGYDGLRRMTQAWTIATATCQTGTPTADRIGGPEPYWNTYTFDEAGSRLTETQHAVAGGAVPVDIARSYTTPGRTEPQAHALTRVDTTLGQDAPKTTDTFTYDAAGNTLTHNKNTGSTATSTGAVNPSTTSQNSTYTWDEFGKLAKAVTVDSATDSGAITSTETASSFVYDTDGNRILRKDSRGTTIYLGDIELHAETPTSVVTATRTYSAAGAILAVRATHRGLTWMASDHHGTPQLTIDQSTLAVTRRKTDPFGNPRGPQPTWPNQKGFVGGTLDPETALIHIGARDYDPVNGRFVSLDPLQDLADPQSWHGYSYANNAPATTSDPSGLMRREDPDDAGFALTAAPAGRRGSGAGTAGNGSGNGGRKNGGLGARVGNWWKCVTGVSCPRGNTDANHDGKTTLGDVVNYTAPRCNIHGRGAAACGALESAQQQVGDLVGDFSGANDVMACSEGDAIACGWAGVALVGLATGGAATAAVKGTAVTAKAARAAKAAAMSRAARSKVPCTHSFASTTLVLLADGSEKPIGDIAVGDEVLTFDPVTMRTSFQQVTAVHVSDDSELTDVTVVKEEGETTTLHTTENHPFWDATDGQWVKAAELQPGHHFLVSGGESVYVSTVHSFKGMQRMHDLTVAGTHTYYVSVSGASVLVHNCGEGVPYGVANLKDGAYMATSDVLDTAVDFLSKGYRDMGGGRFLSKDGLRQVRLTNADLAHPRQNPHLNFEVYSKPIGPGIRGAHLISNIHIYIPEEMGWH